MLTNGLMDLKFWTCFLEVRWIEVWTCFLEVHGFEFGRVSQRSDRFVEGDICANVYGSFTLVPAK